jgi:hypothetical protein
MGALAKYLKSHPNRFRTETHADVWERGKCKRELGIRPRDFSLGYLEYSERLAGWLVLTIELDPYLEICSRDPFELLLSGVLLPLNVKQTLAEAEREILGSLRVA